MQAEANQKAASDRFAPYSGANAGRYLRVSDSIGQGTDGRRELCSIRLPNFFTVYALIQRLPRYTPQSTRLLTKLPQTGSSFELVHAVLSDLQRRVRGL